MSERNVWQYKGKSVLVAGMARSGIAAAELLSKKGASVTITDLKGEEELADELRPLNGLNIQRKLGRKTGEVLEECLKSAAAPDTLVLSPGIPSTLPFVKEARDRGVEVIAEIELAYRLSTGPVFAITGTNGKTTTTTLICEIFKAAGLDSVAVGNIGYPFSLAALEDSPERHYVCECSSFQMETVDGFHPHVAAFLNLTEDHLNRHGTMDEYARLKMRVFEQQEPDDFAVFNADDPALSDRIRKVQGHVLLFSRKEDDGRIEDGAFVRNGMVVYRFQGREEEILPAKDIYIPGPHNLENALAAVCFAGAIGIPASVIAQTLRTFRGVEHRIEWTRELDGVTYYNDSKGTNVDSTIRAVQTMDKNTVIILGGSDKHCDFSPLAQEIIRSGKILEAVIIGQTGDQIDETLRRFGYDHITRAKDMKEAVDVSRALAGDGWNVLLSPACASFDMFHDYEERGRIFKELVRGLK
ncbi:MAG: UDP-N-acetylmuramoyl-L-alanine--D-glutamate ligase [Clostridia bacterium]|nr:UDP-N-acetylmuramoyl-L-alanine--D-glutamate ligase [Clostridia bacterium]